MNVGIAFSLAFLIAVVAFLTVVASKIWKGDERATEKLLRSFAGMPFDITVRRGMVRAVVPLLAQLTATLGAVVFALIGMATWHGGSKFTPLMVVALSLLVLAVLTFLVQISIIWFNRPRWLVPPPLRGDVGTITARRRM